MKCSNCMSMVEQDAMYCSHCGYQIEKRPAMKTESQRNIVPYPENISCERGRKLFAAGFFGCDIIGSTVLGFLGVFNIWIYFVGFAFYLLAIYFSAQGVVFARNLKKNGKPGTGMLTGAIIMVASASLIVFNGISIFNFLV